MTPRNRQSIETTPGEAGPVRATTKTKSSIAASVAGRTGAGIAGAGSGTLLVVLANNLPPSHWKTVLVIAAPSVSIVSGYLWNKITQALDQYLANRSVQSMINKATQNLKQALANPDSSAQHRQQLKRKLEELEMLVINSDMEKIKSLRLHQ